jgi:hypothetical protein
MRVTRPWRGHDGRMLTDEEAARLAGATLVSSDGQELGDVEEVLTHSADNRAAWVAARVDERLVVVPLDGASVDGDRLTVRYVGDQVRAAPELAADRLDAHATDELYAHYGIDDSTLRDDSGFPTEEGARGEAAPSSRDPRGGTGADDAAQGHP